MRKAEFGGTLIDIPEQCKQGGYVNKIYLIGSLRNPQVPKLANELRNLGYTVFDDWFAAGEIADDAWRDYEQDRGHNFREALKGYAANHVFDFDMHHLNESTIGILLLPAGKSGHLELGYLIGRGCKSYIVYPEEPERFDVMYLMADAVFGSEAELLEYLRLALDKSS